MAAHSGGSMPARSVAISDSMRETPAAASSNGDELMTALKRSNLGIALPIVRCRFQKVASGSELSARTPV